ncbi:MAG: CAP domain-containing protein [Deltaproteobacteria bacterium]|nr:CAP domain-containing protein [Deltaproteobacteria bacterium]
MKSTTSWAMVLAVVTAVFLCPPSAWGQLRIHSGAAKSGGEHPKALEQRVFQLTNEARRKNGLPPLDQDKELSALARQKGDDLIKVHGVSQADHDPLAKRSLKSYSKEEPAKIGWGGKPGENIHMGSKDDYSDVETSARLIVNGFMGNSGLRNNILNSGFTRLGVGASVKGKESYVVQEFKGNETGGK